MGSISATSSPWKQMDHDDPPVQALLRRRHATGHLRHFIPDLPALQSLLPDHRHAQSLEPGWLCYLHDVVVFVYEVGPAMKSALMVRAGGRSFDLTVNTETAGELLGLSDETIRKQCENGTLPTLARRGKGSTWRIPTGRLLEALGIPYEVFES